ncbi:hypothetical protein ACWC5G_14960, partial [Streptomyces sp. NPDC001274]
MARTEEIAGTGTGEGRFAGRGGWPAVAAVSGATFTVVTSEMLPVGLLTPLGNALRVSEERRRARHVRPDAGRRLGIDLGGAR